MKIIDVSKHNGKIKWDKIKGVDGVIIRCGSGRLGIDPKFTENIKGALSVGLPVGVYFFSYAYSVGQAQEEAKKCLEYIKGYKLTLPVFFDWEYDSYNYAKSKGVLVTGPLLTMMTRAFLDPIKKAGYQVGNYYNLDYVKRGLTQVDKLSDYFRWFARYTSTPQKDCDLWQYTSSGTVDGVNGPCDVSEVINTAIFKHPVYFPGLPEMFVKQAQKWLGLRKDNGTYKIILDTYNNHTPLPRGYRVKTSDQWCATFVSACAIASGYDIPLECSCQKMIEGFKNRGGWIENDNYIPAPGAVIFYDWDDDGKGDDTGWADHVGIVESCNGKTIVVIEGNKGGAVARRTIAVGARYIRGFGLGIPKPEQITEPIKEKEPVNYLRGLVMPELKEGSTGKVVKVWQAIIGTSVDGKFGPQTLKKTKAFQKSNGLSQDGIVGPKTWTAGLRSVGGSV